jgi:hypothetical protein
MADDLDLVITDTGMHYKKPMVVNDKLINFGTWSRVGLQLLADVRSKSNRRLMDFTSDGLEAIILSVVELFPIPDEDNSDYPEWASFHKNIAASIERLQATYTGYHTTWINSTEAKAFDGAFKAACDNAEPAPAQKTVPGSFAGAFAKLFGEFKFTSRKNKEVEEA